jgi:hypothetical protein
MGQGRPQLIPMSDSIESLTIQNRYLASEIERLRNNTEYLDQKLDEELEKSAMLCGQILRLEADVRSLREKTIT